MCATHIDIPETYVSQKWSFSNDPPSCTSERCDQTPFDVLIFNMGHIMRKPVLCYANNKDPDQPAHPRSLISALVVHSLDSIISIDAISKIARL